MLLLFLPSSIFLLPSDAFGVTIHPKAGTTSATFLKLGVGSRPNAMGGTFAGLADDVTAMYWNPAGLGRLKNPELHLTHNEVFENIRHDFAAYCFPKWNGMLGIAIFGLYMPKDIEKRGGLNESDPYEPISPVEGYFTAYDMAAQVSYGRKYRKNTFTGASFKVIRQTIDTESAYGAALDLGILHQFESAPLSAGFVIQHIGTPIKFINTGYDLPLNIKLGAAYRWNERLMTTLDFNQPNDNYLFTSAGMEYSILRFMAVRAGYKYRLNGLELGDLSGLSAGVGFIFPLTNSRLKFDYAFLPYGVLGNSHRISIGVEFGNFESEYFGQTRKEPAAEKKKQTRKTEPAPPPPVIEPQPAVDKLKDYTVFKTQINSGVKTANNRSSLFIINAVSSGGDIKSVDAVLRARSAQDLEIDIGEKPGAPGEKTYKNFAFRTNSPAPIQKADIKLRLLKSAVNPSARTRDGKNIVLEKISEDENSITYGLQLNELQDFAIVSE
ncbi:MAG: PorV/PorQ family protein [Elusimicrobiota bacterium]